MRRRNIPSKERRQHRVRMKIRGDRFRLTVSRSNRNVYAQIIDDVKGKTLVSASQRELVDETMGKTERALAVGKLLATKAKKKKISKVVFDRGNFAYHGRIKAVADGAREGGLQF